MSFKELAQAVNTPWEIVQKFIQPLVSHGVLKESSSPSGLFVNKPQIYYVTGYSLLGLKNVDEPQQAYFRVGIKIKEASLLISTKELDCVVTVPYEGDQRSAINHLPWVVREILVPKLNRISERWSPWNLRRAYEEFTSEDFNKMSHYGIGVRFDFDPFLSSHRSRQPRCQAELCLYQEDNQVFSKGDSIYSEPGLPDKSKVVGIRRLTDFGHEYDLEDGSILKSTVAHVINISSGSTVLYLKENGMGIGKVLSRVHRKKEEVTDHSENYSQELLNYKIQGENELIPFFRIVCILDMNKNMKKIQSLVI